MNSGCERKRDLSINFRILVPNRKTIHTVIKTKKNRVLSESEGILSDHLSVRNTVHRCSWM